MKTKYTPTTPVHTPKVTPTTLTLAQNIIITNMFSYCRPHGSTSEQEWLNVMLMPLLESFNPYIDDIGNIHVDTRQTQANRTLFTAHIDTVHRGALARQTTLIDCVDGINTLYLPTPTQKSELTGQAPNCLGADDTAGVMVLLHMLLNGVNAYYIFTRGEEVGGIGARYLADHSKELLHEFDRAIAFDRKGTSSVITHQGMGRCCSDEFANALSDALGNDTLMYAPDDTGVYTDTAEFVSIIPECTNVSVGYYREHTVNETLDLDHMIALIAQVVTIDWDNLPTTRDPSVVDDWRYGSWQDTWSDNYTPLNDTHTVYSTQEYRDNWDNYDALEPTLRDIEQVIDALESLRSGDAVPINTVLSEHGALPAGYEVAKYITVNDIYDLIRYADHLMMDIEDGVFGDEDAVISEFYGLLDTVVEMLAKETMQ